MLCYLQILSHHTLGVSSHFTGYFFSRCFACCFSSALPLIIGLLSVNILSLGSFFHMITTLNFIPLVPDKEVKTQNLHQISNKHIKLMVNKIKIPSCLPHTFSSLVSFIWWYKHPLDLFSFISHLSIQNIVKSVGSAQSIAHLPPHLYHFIPNYSHAFLVSAIVFCY